MNNTFPLQIINFGSIFLIYQMLFFVDFYICILHSVYLKKAHISYNVKKVLQRDFDHRSDKITFFYLSDSLGMEIINSMNLLAIDHF